MDREKADVYQILERCEAPYVCGGPPARVQAALSHGAACRRAVRAGVFPAFFGKLYAAAPFLAGASMAAQGLASLAAAGIPFARGRFAVSMTAAADERAAAGAAAVTDGLSLRLDREDGAFCRTIAEAPSMAFLARFAEKQTIFPSFSRADSAVSLFLCPFGPDGLPVFSVMRAVFAQFAQSEVRSAAALSAGGVAEAVGVMAGRSGIGFAFAPEIDVFSIGALRFGSILAESAGFLPGALPLGRTTAEPDIILPGCTPLALKKLSAFL